MSCYQLTDKHHASIAQWVGKKLKWQNYKIQGFADKLKRYNALAVSYRFNENNPVHKCNIEIYQDMDAERYFNAVSEWVFKSSGHPCGLEFDILQGFLFSLVDFNFLPVKLK